MPQVAAAWTPKGVARVLSCPTAARALRVLLARWHRPLLVFLPVSMGFNAASWAILLRLPVGFKKVPFF